MLKRVANTHQPGLIPETASLRVDFGEITASMSEIERLEAYQRRLDLGIWSPVDAMLADNPDIRTRDDAIAELQRRRDETSILGVGGFAGPAFQETRP